MPNKLNIYKTFQNSNFFIIKILIIILTKVLSQNTVFNAKFMKTVELLDENYIICTEKHIKIVDSNFQNLIFQHNLTSEITNRDDFEFVTISQYPNEDGGRIIVLYKNKVYLIYSPYTNILEANINLNHNSQYYTLVPIKDGNDYNFIIGYIDNKIKLAYYKFNLQNNSVALNNTFTPDLPTISDLSSNPGFSCQIMISNQKGKVLTCFYSKNFIFEVCSFDLGNFSMIEELCNLNDNTVAPIYIHSAISFDKTKSLICYVNSNNNTGHCLNYNINNHELSPLTKISDQCCRNPSSINVFYSIKSKEYLYTCFNYENKFSIAKYNETLNIIGTNNDFKLDYYIGIQFASIIYDYNNNSYNIFMSFGTNNNNNNNEVRYSALPNNLNPSEKPVWSGDPLIGDTDSPSQTNTQTQTQTQTNLVSVSITDKNQVTNSYINIEENKGCAGDFLYENKNTGECLKTCNYSEILNRNCLINKITNENIGEITNEIRNVIKNTNINSNINIIIEGENTVYQIISSKNMNENNNKNLSIIDFGECENILERENNIDYLVVLIIDTKININTPNIINYEVYNPDTVEILNLSVCQNITINTYTNFAPSKETLDKIMKLNESGFDLYNINDSFYQDLCTPFTSDDGTDILLSDRVNDFYDNISLCEIGCTYSKYDYITQRVKCECQVKNEININNEKKVDKDSFFSNFIDEDTFSNIKVLKCFKLVFSKEGQSNNIGSYIFLILIFSLIVLSVIYRIYQIRNIMRILRKIIKVENYTERKNENINNINNNIKDNINFNDNTNNYNKPNDNTSIITNKNIKPSPPKKRKKKRNTVLIYNKSKDNNAALNDIIKNENDNKIICEKVHDFNQTKNNNSSNTLPYVKMKTRNTLVLSSVRGSFFPNSQNNDIILGENKINEAGEKSSEKVKTKNKYNYNNEELNALSYKDAIKYDKRTFGQYYCSLLRKKHLLLFTFFNNEDYNVFTLKLALLLFSFSLYFAVCSLFFVNSTVHNIYEKQGRRDLLFQIPNILYSTLISAVISLVIKILALSNRDMIRIKQIENLDEALKESALLLDKLILRFNLFFIICFLFMVFFWYFIAAFCAVYKNTQKILFENTLSSFALSMIYPFGLNLLPGLLRIPSLENNFKCSEILYKISKLIAYI